MPDPKVKKPIDYTQQIKTGQTMSNIGTALGVLGSLGNVVNQIYQASRGYNPIDVGNIPISIGQGLGAFGTMKQQRGKQGVALEYLDKADLNPILKDITKAQVLGGDPDKAFGNLAKGLRNSQPNSFKEWQLGQTNPEYNTWLKSRPSGAVTISLEDRQGWQTAQNIVQDVNSKSEYYGLSPAEMNKRGLLDNYTFDLYSRALGNAGRVTGTGGKTPPRGLTKPTPPTDQQTDYVFDANGNLMPTR